LRSSFKMARPRFPEAYSSQSEAPKLTSEDTHAC
jgi:hypothetical protein